MEYEKIEIIMINISSLSIKLEGLLQLLQLFI